MQNVIKKDLGFSAFKKKKIHELTRENMADRVAKSRLLLKTHASYNIIFSDEKLFTLEATLNKQNDRVYGVFLRDMPAEKKSSRAISKCVSCDGSGRYIDQRETTIAID